MDSRAIYKKYFVDNHFEREGLFEMLVNDFGVEKGLYPGSFTHITPSYYIPYMVYIDSDKQAKKFFSDKEMVTEMISERKKYPEDAQYAFFSSSYTSPIAIEDNSFDLIISQYAGVISQPCKRYLKKGGLLLANNSHGDAGVANMNLDYELIGVVNSSAGKFRFSNKELEKYFHTKSGKVHTIEELIALGKGVGYANTAPNYLFKLLV